jgi:hypothetical protein
MINSLFLRLLTLVIFWLGLGVLRLNHMTDNHFFPLAAVFSLIVLLGAALEFYFHYAGDRYLVPAVETILAIGLVLLIRIKPHWRRISLFGRIWD